MGTEYLLTLPPRSDTSPTQLHKCPHCKRITTAVGKAADTPCGICLAQWVRNQPKYIVKL